MRIYIRFNPNQKPIKSNSFDLYALIDKIADNFSLNEKKEKSMYHNRVVSSWSQSQIW